MIDRSFHTTSDQEFTTMHDPIAARADAIHDALIDMERDASAEELFPLGYLIPQIPLVVDQLDYDPSEVTSDDFDAVFHEWLDGAFAQDGMSDADQSAVRALFNQACAKAPAP
ncbi:hypothetical protein NFG57_09510 [Halomonas sp. H10-59]|uniref:Uncharacterized protein n=2 Tax=unclassified Halomonas TaxID=2609666 RepID=A0AAU7KZC3_9GAMM